MTDNNDLRQWLDSEASEGRFSGVALAWQDGAPIFSHAAGLASRAHQVPVTAASRFAVASVGKMITAAAALSLVEEGRLSLHTPVIEVLAEAHRIDSLGDDHTLHHLLSQTSALPNYFDDDDPTWASWNASWDRIPTYHIRQPADLLPLFNRLPRVGAVGERYRYCDSNYVMIGLAIEAVTGQPYPEIATRRVLEPAGMADSSFTDLDLDPVGLATGYLASDEPQDRWRSNMYSLTAAAMPDGGMISTATDMARFTDALMQGALVSPAMFELMKNPQSGPEEGGSYGYGLELVLEGDHLVLFGHGGSDPGVATLVNHYPDQNLTVVVLCNQDRGAFAAELRVGGAFGAPEHP